MPRVIIEIHHGIINGVYTDILENLEVKICDPDDIFDDERSAEFSALQHQIKHGGLHNIAGFPVRDAQCTAGLDPNAFLLIREPYTAKSEVGKTAQRLSAAFVDGYLTAHAELSRYLMRIYREKVADAATIHHTLIPLLDQQNFNYDKLCEDLNRPELYDENITEH